MIHIWVYFLYGVLSIVDSVFSGTYIYANLICVAFIGMTPVPSAASASLLGSAIPSSQNFSSHIYYFGEQGLHAIVLS